MTTGPTDASRTAVGRAQRALPDDIDPESRNRLPLPVRDSYETEEERRIFDRTVAAATSSLRGASGPGAGLRGPAGIQLHSPQLRDRAQAVNYYLRFQSGMDSRIREIAILVTARELNHQFEWTAHETMALNEGVAPETIDIIRYRRDAKGLPDAEAAIIALGREAIGRRKVSPETFARAKSIFGARGLVELTALMGEYAATSILLTVFDQQLHPHWNPLLPDTD